MKALFFFTLFCHFIYATDELKKENNPFRNLFSLLNPFNYGSHSKGIRHHLKKEKTAFERLPDGPLLDIADQLDEKDKKEFSATAKEFFKFDPREVVMNFPLKERKKEPTQFVCNHLKIRKKVIIKLKHHLLKPLLDQKSLEMKYLKCLSGIENLEFEEFSGASKILANPNFKISELFPQLQHLRLDLDNTIPLDAIPNNLKSLKLYLKQFEKGTELKEKISHMHQLEWLFLKFVSRTARGSSVIPAISELKTLPKFKKLEVVFFGHINVLTKILDQTKEAHYYLDLQSTIDQDVNGDTLFNKLPETSESLNLISKTFVITQDFCNILSNMKHLKQLILNPKEMIHDHDCLLKSLPSSLTDLIFTDSLRTSDIKDITLPKNLYSVSFRSVKSNVFELLANHVPVLETAVSDPQILLTIEKPFTRVKTLIYDDLLENMSLGMCLQLLDLLPQEMDFVEFCAFFRNEREFFTLEEQILSIGKRIRQFNLIMYTSYMRTVGRPFSKESTAGGLNGKYVFDGTKMIKIE